jgi:hypothetical protein
MHHASPGRPLAPAIDCFLEATVVLSFTDIGPMVRRRLFDWQDLDALRMDGRVVLITGGSSGLGRATAERLARMGAAVRLLVRDPAKGARAFSGTEKPKASGGTFKIMIVDSMIQKILREIELQKPANVRLVIQNADHNPPGTLPRPHYFLISNRTPIIWVQAYKNLKQRMIDIGDKPGVEAYVEQLSRISQLPWFDA